MNRERERDAHFQRGTQLDFLFALHNRLSESAAVRLAKDTEGRIINTVPKQAK